jgi:hypothetical protein
MNTKMLIAAAVIGTVIASPALAQTARSRSDFQQSRQQHSVNPRYDVYENGTYVGSDPDPNIRLQLRREQGPGSEW